MLIDFRWLENNMKLILDAMGRMLGGDQRSYIIAEHNGELAGWLIHGPRGDLIWDQLPGHQVYDPNTNEVLQA